MKSWKQKSVVSVGILLGTLFSLVLFFQNCSQVHLLGKPDPVVASQPSTSPPPVSPSPEPEPETVTMQPGFTPTQNASPVYTGCPISGTSWWLGTRSVPRPGGGVGLQCLFNLGANQFLNFYFHTPTLADAQKNNDATMGNLVLNNAFFAISRTQAGQSLSAPSSCIGNKNVFVNWALSGATTDQVVGARSDVCFLAPDTDYWVVVSQPQAVDANATVQTCDGDDGQTCMYAFDVNVDTIVVDEGYDAAPTCQYQPNDPIFAQGTEMADRGRVPVPIDADPRNFTFGKTVTAFSPDRVSISQAIDLDIGVLNPLYPSNSKTKGLIVALKFVTPKFGENAGAVHHELAPDAGYQSSIGPYTSLQSISECPGDFTSPNVSARNMTSGYNLLQANGHYINQDVYAMGIDAGGHPTGFQTRTPSPYRALKANVVYYYNIQAPPSPGCGTFASPSSSFVYCATGRTNSFGAGDLHGFGQLFILSEQK